MCESSVDSKWLEIITAVNLYTELREPRHSAPALPYPPAFPRARLLTSGIPRPTPRPRRLLAPPFLPAQPSGRFTSDHPLPEYFVRWAYRSVGDLFKVTGLDEVVVLSRLSCVGLHTLTYWWTLSPTDIYVREHYYLWIFFSTGILFHSHYIFGWVIIIFSPTPRSCCTVAAISVFPWFENLGLAESR